MKHISMTPMNSMQIMAGFGLLGCGIVLNLPHKKFLLIVFTISFILISLINLLFELVNKKK